jgi:hypothetical protein
MPSWALKRSMASNWNVHLSIFLLILCPENDEFAGHGDVHCRFICCTKRLLRKYACERPLDRAHAQNAAVQAIS